MPRQLGIQAPVDPPSEPNGAQDGLEVQSSSEGLFICPICDDEMVTLAQLNQHLDDAHKEIVEPKQDQIPQKGESWLGIGLLLKDELLKAGRSRSPARSSPKPAKPVQMVTHKHWQKRTDGIVCHFEGCNRVVDRYGINCRKCGFIYCREHCSYRQRLDKDAHRDVEGIWSRVCESCFDENLWWQDTSGGVNDLTDEFKNLRQVQTDSRALVVDRLEKRMVKLVKSLAEVEDAADGIFTFKDGQKGRQIEQSIVPWEEEKSVERCRLCGQKFSYFRRKHHCRVCGRVVCADIDRDCSRDVSISLLAEKLERSALAPHSTYPIRVCSACRDTVFGHKNFLQETSAKPPKFMQLYVHLKRKRDQIDALLPRFQEFAGKLGEGDSDPAIISETRAIRTQLLTAFSQFDAVARKIRDETTSTATEEWVKQRISTWAADYLQVTMLPLQTLPRLLQNREEPRMRKDEEERQQNKLVVLEEQRYMVAEMVAKAKSGRKFDELGPLQVSLDELQQEIEAIRGQLGSSAPQ